LWKGEDLDKIISGEDFPAIIAFRLDAFCFALLNFSTSVQEADPKKRLENKTLLDEVYVELLPVIENDMMKFLNDCKEKGGPNGRSFLDGYFNLFRADVNKVGRLFGKKKKARYPEQSRAIESHLNMMRLREKLSVSVAAVIDTRMERMELIKSLGSSVPEYIIRVLEEGREQKEDVSVEFLDRCLEKDVRAKEEERIEDDPEITQMLAEEERREHRKQIKGESKCRREAAAKLEKAPNPKETADLTDQCVQNVRNSLAPKVCQQRPSDTKGFKVVTSPPKKSRVKPLLPIDTHPRVLRCDTVNLDEIKAFPDRTPDGNLRYEKMNEAQLKEQRARHCVRGLPELLNFPGFKEKYLSQTPEGGLLITHIETLGINEQTLTSIGLNSEGELYHVWIHIQKQLVPEKGSLLGHLFKNAQFPVNESFPAPLSGTRSGAAVSIEEIPFNGHPIIKISFSFGGESTVISFYPLRK
jgi:hypothetical protein